MALYRQAPRGGRAALGECFKLFPILSPITGSEGATEMAEHYRKARPTSPARGAGPMVRRLCSTRASRLTSDAKIEAITGPTPTAASRDQPLRPGARARIAQGLTPARTGRQHEAEAQAEIPPRSPIRMSPKGEALESADTTAAAHGSRPSYAAMTRPPNGHGPGQGADAPGGSGQEAPSKPSSSGAGQEAERRRPRRGRAEAQES